MDGNSNTDENEALPNNPPSEDQDNYEELWNQSPLTYNDDAIELPPGILLENNDSIAPDEFSVTIADDVPPVIVAPPGAYHRREYQRFFPETLEDSSEDEGEESEEEAELLIESKSLRDNNTLFGSVMTKTNVSATQAFLFDGNTEQVKNATAVVDAITEKPFNQCWNYFTEGYPIVLYFVNLIVAVYDLIKAPNNLHFKIPSFIFGIIENIILWTVLVAFTLKKRKDDKHEKYQQYVENIVHEIIVYPTIILSVVGFSTDKLWKPENALEYTSLVLLCLDGVDLLKTMGNRMFIIYRLMSDIQKKVLLKDDLTCSDWKFGAGILPRTLFTIVGNTVLFFLLIFLFGAQVAKDNPVKETGYLLSTQSAVLLVALIVLPLLSTLIFLVANSFWLLEIFLTINLNAVDMSKELAKGSYDASLSDAIQFASKKASQTRERWSDIQQLTKWQKIFYGLTEVYTIALFFLWEALVVACVYCFQGYTDQLTLWALRSTCLLFGTLVNFHTVVLSISANILTPVVIGGLAVYPAFIICCFKKKNTVRQDSGLDDDDDDDELIKV